MILLKLYIVYLIDLFYLWLMFRNFCINKEISNKGNQGSNYFKDTMLIEKLKTFVNKWNYNKMAFIDELRIDIRTQKMLNNT